MDLDSVVADTVTVIRGVKPNQWDAPTPCRDWTVRALANHLGQVIEGFRLAGTGAPVPDDIWTRDTMSVDWATRFEETAHAAVAAWADPAAVDRTVPMAGSAMPASLIRAMFVSDLILHAWDLARATGQDFDSDYAEAAVRFLTDTGAQGRAMGLYAEPVPVTDTASVLERALALSGRDPQWTPAGRPSGR